ncbi:MULTISPECIES: DNA-3-methyladenine glycosylase [Streptomyces]|uniref:Putative 3-methyladenine DNA glycosylase n=1 Tax=Streptomyces glycanivorans TaxID=3033808 RepID=A0ABY9JLE7_9ACTN|nr:MULTISPECIES: DNA-3-methyladenine glycosylase [unclassified Streptomyces]WSQ80771.1 DNA-3-methyladenine glycosylase [Streptomyces sp. NBC_01213]TXS08001.1 DNA-3-methyladenine glycosylase [Streptomyces sp. wa22]WLQ67349.1 DNA-3-methyladenine glycosylase [Streptomyces sp. Alt3]WSQ88103.1 DNA-3-methyladenine glycosylase [Streptomyces sp. NBC_01212]WSR05889.1 DNA-3-methyladenine glycosylase [Streptomyces sp. NBC_01208]
MNVETLAHPAEEVAPRLLGSVLTCKTSEGTVSIAITETEAYSGAADPASHAYRGRTPRNAVMFGPAGHLYVYRSHGLHWCANVVTGTDGVASAVLIRAGRVVEGEDLARERRGEKVETARLARGPGNFCQALGITAEHNGTDLLTGIPVVLSEGESVPPALIRVGPRVGVSKAHDWQHRFYLAGDPTVSAYRLSPRAKPSG